MDIFEIIRHRHSSRTFNGLRLDTASARRLKEEIGSLPRLYNDVAIPVIRLVDNDKAKGKLGTYGFITGARQFLVMASGSTTAEQVQAGFMFEALILKAEEMGLGTCWLGGTFRSGPFSEAFSSVTGEDGMTQMRDGMEISIVSPVGHPTPKRRLAERVMRSVVKSDQRKPYDELFQGISAGTPLGRVMQAVRLAPSSGNAQPWRASVTEDTDTGGHTTVVSFRCATSNRFSAIDMGIAYCHFILASREVGLSWETDRSSNPLSLVFRSR